MFESFYGLREDPFRLSSDHRFCFPHRNYIRARAYIDYALHRAEGFVMVTGSPGTGKTTLINQLLSELPQQTTRAATLLSTRLEAEDLLRMTAYSLGLKTREPSKAMLLQGLMERMAEDYRRGIRTLLIIDEAQDLGASALEELRLLTNLHEAGMPLLQILLVGQEPLRQLVRRPEMEQLHQRLIAAWHLQPLDPHETLGYVRHRLEAAGWRGDPVFERGVLETVFAFSQGVPRRINLICSRLLLHGCLSEQHRLTREDALRLVAELGAEELAPAVKDASDASKDPKVEVDWSEIDQGLEWIPPEPAASVTETSATTKSGSRDVTSRPFDPESTTDIPPADNRGIPIEMGQQPDQAPPQAPAVSSGASIQDQIEADSAARLDSQPIGLVSAEGHAEARSSQVAGLVVEDPGEPTADPSAGRPMVSTSNHALRSARRRPLIIRLIPFILSVLAFFVLLLMPAEIFERPVYLLFR